MTDEQLLQKLSAARGEAHRATKKNWAACGNRFMELATEAQRRGLAMPDCDCVSGHGNVSRS